MRIRDWSSDVCSSDLSKAEIIKSADGKELVMRLDGASVADTQMMAAAPELLDALKNLIDAHDRYMGASRPDATATTTERKRGVKGKSVSVRVAPGGRQDIKKKQQKKYIKTENN